MTSFQDLSDDIFYLILHFLGQFQADRSSTLRLFRLVSQRLRDFAESILYRNIILQDDEQHELASYRFIERLCNPYDPLRQHVRSLQIKFFKGDDHSYCINTKFISACLKNIQNLKSFSWDSDVALSDDLLTTFHQCAPNAQLDATVRFFNRSLLRSSQLRRLKISLPFSDFTAVKSMIVWKELKIEILQCHNLRDLSLDVHPDVSPLPLSGAIQPQGHDFTKLCSQCWSFSPTDCRCPSMSSSKLNRTVQLPLEPGDKLPPLEDFDIRAKAYNLDINHCTQLLDCMDWGKLKRLRLGQSNPEGFFMTFKDKLPQLEVLDFTHHHNGSFWNYKDADLSACAEFVASISALREVVIRCDGFNPQGRFWSALVAVHGPHLQFLSIQPRYPGLEAPGYSCNFNLVLKNFSSLVHLDLARGGITSSSIQCASCYGKSHALNVNYTEIIPVIPSLRSLKISVRCNLSHQLFYSHVADHAYCAIRSIWTAYANASQDCELEEVSILFWRWEPGSPHIKDRGRPRQPHIKTLIFDSHMTRKGLMIKVRNHPNVKPVFYSQVWLDSAGTGLQVTYLAEETVVDIAPLVVSHRFHQIRGIT